MPFQIINFKTIFAIQNSIMDFRVVFFLAAGCLLIGFSLARHFYYKNKHRSLLSEIQGTEYSISKNAEVTLFYKFGLLSKTYFYRADVVFMEHNIFVLQRHYLIKSFCAPIIQFYNSTPKFPSRNVWKSHYYTDSSFSDSFIKLIDDSSFETDIKLKEHLSVEKYGLTAKS